MLVNDYYPVNNSTNLAKDDLKPSFMFDGIPETFFHSRLGSPEPGVNISFGSTYTVTKITFIPRVDYYLANNENTMFTLIKENGDEEDCATLTGTNTESSTVEAQTYEIPCANKQGVGLKVWRSAVFAWCPAEIEIFYSNRKYNLTLIRIETDSSYFGIGWS